jgi:hypothetical protein
MSDTQMEPIKRSLYSLLAGYIDDTTLVHLYDNFTRNDSLLSGVNTANASFLEKPEIMDLLVSSFKTATSYIDNLSPDRIDEHVGIILSKLVTDNRDGKWNYLNKNDIFDDKLRYNNLFNNEDNFYLKYEQLDPYLPNAWNNAICVRALVNWVSLLNFKKETKKEIFEAIKDGYLYLRNFIANGIINKYPLNFTNFNTSSDTAFVLKMVQRIQPFIEKHYPEIKNPPVKDLINSLINAQNKKDGGWPFVYNQNNTSYLNNGKSDLCSTCYTLLLLIGLEDDGSYPIELENSIVQGINFILNHETRLELNLEVTCLMLQVLTNRKQASDYQSTIKDFIEKLLNDNMVNIMNNDIQSLEKSLNGNAVKLISLSLITLLKTGEKITNKIISVSFSWLLKRTQYEEKTNIIYIICCISEYLHARRRFILNHHNVNDNRRTSHTMPW